MDPEKASIIFERLIARGGALHSLTRVVTVSDPALLHHFDLVLDLVVSCELHCKPPVGLASATQLCCAVHHTPCGFPNASCRACTHTVQTQQMSILWQSRTLSLHIPLPCIGHGTTSWYLRCQLPTLQNGGCIRSSKSAMTLALAKAAEQMSAIGAAAEGAPAAARVASIGYVQAEEEFDDRDIPPDAALLEDDGGMSVPPLAIHRTLGGRWQGPAPEKNWRNVMPRLPPLLSMRKSRPKKAEHNLQNVLPLPPGRHRSGPERPEQSWLGDGDAGPDSPKAIDSNSVDKTSGKL